MSEKFTIETATNEQWLDVLDYIFETEPSKLKYLAKEVYYDEFLSDDEIYKTIESHGLDDWYAYDYVQEAAENNCEEWTDLSSSEKLGYMYNLDIDNWSVFENAMREALNELFTSTKPSKLNAEIDDDSAFVDDGVVVAAQDAVCFSPEFEEYFIKKCDEYQNKD